MKIEVIGIDKTIANMKDLFEEKIEKAQVVVKSGCASIKDDAQNRAPVDLWTLRDNIGYRMTKNKNSYVGRVMSKADYSSAVEYGSRAHWAPINAIAEWARWHGLSPKRLQLSIAEKGTQPHPFMTPAYYDNEKKIINGVRQVFKR